MSKPTKVPTWNTDLSNQTEPSGGQKASGWTSGQAAVSSYLNWLLYTIYTWIVYLQAGNLEGNHAIDGTLHVTGATTVDGVLTAKHGNHTLSLSHTDFHAEGALATVSYTDSAMRASNFGGSPGDVWLLMCALKLPVSAQIESITVYVDNNSSATASATLKKGEPSLFGAGGGTVGTINDGGTPGNNSLAIASLPHVVAADCSYNIHMSLHDGDFLYGAKVVYSQPTAI
jgi:hypothetical protein